MKPDQLRKELREILRLNKPTGIIPHPETGRVQVVFDDSEMLDELVDFVKQARHQALTEAIAAVGEDTPHHLKTSWEGGYNDAKHEIRARLERLLNETTK